MKLILFLVILSTFNQLISCLDDNLNYDSTINSTTTTTTIKPLNESLTSLKSTSKPLTTTGSLIDLTTETSTINDSDGDDDDDDNHFIDDNDYNGNENETLTSDQNDKNSVNNSSDDILNGQAQSQRPFILGRGDQANQLQQQTPPITNYGLPFANLIPGLQNGLINGNGNNQRGQLPGPLDLLSRFLPTVRPNINNRGPLTNSFTQQPGTGINQGYSGFGNQNLRPGSMPSRFSSGNSGNFNGLGSPGSRQFASQPGLGRLNGGRGSGRVPVARDEDVDERVRENVPTEPEKDEDEENDQDQDQGVSNEEGVGRGDSETVGGSDSGDKSEGATAEGSSETGQEDEQGGETGGEDEGGESGGSSEEDAEGEGGEGGEENSGEGGDIGNEGGGGGDPSNDPDLAQFERMSQGSNFPGDLFPPGLLSQQDLADIQKSIDEQQKKDAERQRQGGDAQGDSSNSSPEYDDEGTAAATDQPTSYIQPNHRGAYNNPPPNQRKYGDFLNQQQQLNQRFNGRQQPLKNYRGDSGQFINQRPSAYSSRNFNPNNQQLNPNGDGYFADSNLHTDIESVVDYSPALINNNNQPATQLNNVPHQSTINNNLPASIIDYDDEIHSSNPDTRKLTKLTSSSSASNNQNHPNGANHPVNYHESKADYIENVDQENNRQSLTANIKSKDPFLRGTIRS